MQITLKQRNIETALKQYIVAQGINLDGKKVSVEFTAGRKESGIIAEIDIEDSTDELTPVTLGTVTQLASTEPAQAPAPEPEPEGTDTPEPVAAVAPAGSLFN